jgi:tRNA isopentenyl-2-thiomethyl-A-37 hydroxylase MiaE
MKEAAKVKRKRYKKQILDKISNLSPEESKEFWKILRSIDKKKMKIVKTEV